MAKVKKRSAKKAVKARSAPTAKKAAKKSTKRAVPAKAKRSAKKKTGKVVAASKAAPSPVKKPVKPGPDEESKKPMSSKSAPAVEPKEADLEDEEMADDELGMSGESEIEEDMEEDLTLDDDEETSIILRSPKSYWTTPTTIARTSSVPTPDRTRTFSLVRPTWRPRVSILPFALVCDRLESSWSMLPVEGSG